LRNAVLNVKTAMLLEDLAMNVTLIQRNLSKILKTLDETLVKDAAVVTSLANLVKTVPPANLVTLPKSLVTAMSAIDVDADEEARVILLVNLATTKKKLKKQLKLLFFEETYAEAVKDAAVETPLANLVKTVRPTNLVKTVLPVSPVTLRKSLVTAMIANVGMDVAATDVDTGAREILPANHAMTTKKKLKKRLKPLFSDGCLVEAVEDAAVGPGVTPLVNLVKTVLPVNLVTLRKSLVTAMIAKVVVDVAIEDADTGAREILPANLAMMTKKKLKKPLKRLFSDEC